MTEQTGAVAVAENHERVLDVLGLAFAADPVMRWFWPEPGVYLMSFPRFALAVGGRAFAHGSAHVLGRAAALWLPPGITSDDEAITAVMVESVEQSLLADLVAFGDMIHECHPTFDHWYLPFMGVDPFSQGQGLGSTLLRHALALCDRDGTPAYLEASTARSRMLYQRHEFEVVGEIQVGSSPSVWAMLRHPQPSAT